MSQRPPAAPAQGETSLIPTEGWHCSHFYYRFRRDILAKMEPSLVRDGCDALVEALNPQADHATSRLQASVVSGHKADFGLMLLDPDPLKVDAIHQRLLASPLGPALETSYSFISLTEVSEYVPTTEQYAQRLIQEGNIEGSPAFIAKLQAYEARLPKMNQQRLTPEFPDWPATCFYPMNKKREVGENWFLLTYSARHRMMAEHARSGMEFAGKVTQLITVGVGLEDWEWGVTLWSRNPEFLKEIVYRMRFDEASARYAQFGPFYTSYISSADKIIQHCRLVPS